MRAGPPEPLRAAMLETALIAFTTYFATIGPADVAALFAALTPDNTPAERRQMALKGTLIATAILLVFALFGEAVLRLFGISLPALRIAGGILLLLIAIDMVFGRPSGGTTTTSAETAEAALKDDISVFPLATPLIAGPGAIGATMLLVADAQGDRLRVAVVILVLLGMLLLTFLLLLIATQVHRLLGVTGLHVVSRVVGVLLAALAVQFILDGIRTSGRSPGLSRLLGPRKVLRSANREGTPWPSCCSSSKPRSRRSRRRRSIVGITRSTARNCCSSGARSARGAIRRYWARTSTSTWRCTSSRARRPSSGS
jgi:multiple antibiotic resistance protein